MRKQIKLLKRYYSKELNIPEENIVAFNIVKVKSPSEVVFYLEESNGDSRIMTHVKRDLSFISELTNAVVTNKELRDCESNYRNLVVNKLNLLFGMNFCESDIQYVFLKDNVLNACVSRNSMRFQGDFQIKIIE